MLPSTLETIGRNAFNGCNHLVYVTVPQNVNMIGDYAFNGCVQLRFAELDGYQVSIGYHAFYNVHPEFEIICPVYSDAVEYAVKNNYRFVPVDAENPDSVIIRDQTVYTANQSARSNTGYNDLLMNYAVKEDRFPAMSDVQLGIVVNENMSVFDDSVWLNNEQIGGYSFDNNELRVPVDAQSGTLRVIVNQTGSDRFFSVAKLIWNENGKEHSEIIGYIYNETPTVSVAVPSGFSSEQLSVSGFAPSGAEVSLYVDGTFAAKVNATKAGTYKAVLAISNPVNNKTYTIKASTQADGNTIESTAVTRYKQGAPEVTDFRMYYWIHDDAMNYGEEYIDLTDQAALKQTVTFNPNYGYSFMIGLTNRQSVEHVYVSSTRDGVTKMLEAVYDPEKNMYVTEGLFDPDNSGYVPGTLSVVLAGTSGTVDFYGEVSADDPDYFQDLPDNLTGAEASPVTTTVKDGITTKTTTVTLNDEQHSQVAVTYTEQISKQNPAVLLADGFVEVHGVNGQTGYVKIELEKSTLKETVYDAGTDTLMTLALEDWSGGPLYDIWGLAEEGMIGNLNCAMTYFEIQAANLSPAQKAEAMRQFNIMRDYYGSKLLVSYMFFVAGMICPELSIPLVLLHAAADRLLLEYFDAKINGRNISWNGIKNALFTMLSELFKGKLKWIIDPSGTIYEGNTDGTLEGVTVTVYYKDPETGEVSEWNADDYDQINPIITTSDGTFSWDVPEGLWQVKAEKAGYETVLTEWLEVPPPQTGLIIRMNPTESPSIETINAYTDGIDITFSQYMNTETLSNLKVKDAKGNDVVFELIPGAAGTDEAGNRYTRNVRLAFAKEKTYGTELKVVSASALFSAAGAELNDIDEALTVGFRGIEKAIAFRHSCSFGNNLAINYYAPVSDLEGYENIRMEIRKQIFNDDGSITWSAAELKKYTRSTVSGVNYYRFAYTGIAPKEIGAEVRMVLLCEKNGETYVSEEDVYGVGTYAYNRLEASTDGVFKTLIVDMLNYGAKAQEYFNYNKTNPVNAALTEEQKALGTQKDPELKTVEKVTETAGATATFYGKSAVFNSNVELKYYMQFAQTQSLDNVKLVLTYTAINGTAFTEEIKAADFGYDNSYKAYTAKLLSIAAKDVGCTVTAKIYDGNKLISNTLEYSLETYAYNRLIKSTDEVFKAFLREFMKYGFSAEKYFMKTN